MEQEIQCIGNQTDKKSTSRSLKSVLLLTTFLMPLVSIGAGLGFRDHSRASDHSSKQLYQAAVELIRAATGLAAERGLLYSAMYSKEPLSEESRALIQSSRDEVEENYRSATGFLNNEYDSALSHPKYDNAKILKNLGTLRPSIDHQLTMSTSERDLVLANSWFEAATDAIESIDQLSRFVNREISKDNPTLRKILMLQRSALMMREQVGLERAILSSAAQGAELLFFQLSILRDTPIVQSRFDDVVDLTASEAINDTNLASALSKANIAVDNYRDARVDMVDNDGDGYPMSAADWFQYATDTIDTLNGLVIAIVEYAQTKLAKSQG